MCRHNNCVALIFDLLYPKKLQSRFDKLLAVLEKQCQKTCRPMGFDYPFYHEPAKIPADHFQDCDKNKILDHKDPEFETHQMQTFILHFYHAWKSYHEIHDEKEEILGDEILDLYDSYNLQNSYDF